LRFSSTLSDPGRRYLSYTTVEIAPNKWCDQ